MTIDRDTTTNQSSQSDDISWPVADPAMVQQTFGEIKKRKEKENTGFIRHVRGSDRALFRRERMK